MKIGQGIHDISAELYHQDPCPEPSLSNSVAKVLLEQSPKHAWNIHPRLNPNYRSQDSDRFDLGTAAHAMLLEGSTAKIAIIDADDYRTKVAKAERDEARSNGLTPILAKYNIPLNRMVEEARRFIETTELSGLFKNGKPEQTVIWQEKNGAWCRSRIDLLANDHSIILDYKSTTNAAPSYFSERVIRQMGYHFQGGFYRRGLMAVDALCDPEFFLLAQEIEPPYCCSLHALSPARKELAAGEVERAIYAWGRCIHSGDWPGYDARTHWAEPSPWEISEAEIRGDI